jgi:putative tryptophan/tyrosine transport system substrate-binding protein
MKRRDVITLLGGAAAGAIVRPRSARAQQAAMPAIGFLGSESPPLFREQLRIFRKGLADAGFVENQNVTIEFRWAGGRNDLLPALAADLVRRNVDVIVAAGSTPASLAAKQATATIPVVFFTGGNPVALGLVASLNRPGGNVTGITSLGGELAPKRLELLHQLMPTATDMALLVNPTNPSLMASTTKAVEEASPSLGVKVRLVRAGAESDFEPVFASLVQSRTSALVIAIDSFFTGRREKLAAMALGHRIAAIYQYRDFAAAGGVMSYGGNLEEGFRLIGLYAGRILKGQKPADLAVQQATRVELIVNMKAAKTLGLTVPLLLLGRADAVIE